MPVKRPLLDIFFIGFFIRLVGVVFNARRTCFTRSSNGSSKRSCNFYSWRNREIVIATFFAFVSRKRKICFFFVTFSAEGVAANAADCRALVQRNMVGFHQ